VTFLKEKLAWNYLVAVLLIALAAFFAFAVSRGSEVISDQSRASNQWSTQRR